MSVILYFFLIKQTSIVCFHKSINRYITLHSCSGYQVRTHIVVGFGCLFSVCLVVSFALFCMVVVILDYDWEKRPNIRCVFISNNRLKFKVPNSYD